MDSKYCLRLGYEIILVAFIFLKEGYVKRGEGSHGTGRDVLGED